MPEPRLLSPRPLQSPHLSLTVHGQLRHESVGRHRGPKYRVPIKWLQADGSAIAEGDPIVAYDTRIIEWWQDKRHRERDVEVAKLGSNQLVSDRTLQTMRETRRELERDRDLLLTSLAALDAKDREQSEIYRLRAEQAEQRLTHAQASLDRLNTLGTGVSARILQQAQERVARAEQALRSPQLELEIYTQSRRSLERMELKLELAEVDAELGLDNESEGKFLGIKMYEALREYRHIAGSANVDSIDRRLAHFQGIMDDTELVAERPGILAFDPKLELEVGDRHGHVNLAFVLQDDDLLVDIFLPESLRHFAPSGDEQGEAIIHLPSRPDERYRAIVITVGSIVQKSDDESLSGFRCALRPVDPLPIRPGMTLQAELLVPVPQTLRAIPLWFVSDSSQPQVTLANGRRQTVTGFPFGTRFIITSGLADDALLRTPQDSPEADSLRLSGSLQPSHPIYLTWDLPEPSSSRRWYSRSSWILRSILPDGAMVNAGDQLAEVEPGPDVTDRTFELVKLRSQRDTLSRMARIEAEDDLADSRVAWRKAEIAAEKARLAYFATRYVSYELDEVKADVSRKLARLDESTAAREAEDALADTSGFVSEHRKRQRSLAHNLASFENAKSTLRHVAALRRRDWLEVMDDDERMLNTRLGAYDSRLAYSRARAHYQLELNTVRDRQEYRQRQYERSYQYTINHQLLAPRDGRVFHQPSYRGPPVVGQPVYRREMLMMPTSTSWEFEVEVPARLHSGFTAGSELTCRIPALGPEPRPATIKRVSPYFEGPDATEDEEYLRGSVGVTEPVFKLLISCDFSGADAERAAPGLTAYIDISSQ